MVKMFTGHNSKFWDDRYDESGYAYGTTPNQFLTEQQYRLNPGMKTLVVGDGEGRNGVWLATQGLNVLSIDLSPIGLAKAQALANQHQVQIQTQCADLTTWNWVVAEYDLVVSIYVHFAPEVRPQIHRSMLKSLKPGGLIILEAFNLEQLQYQQDYNSGGPPIKEMLYQPEMLRQDFAGGEVLELTETITELHEGQYHDGKASVVRLVLQKNL
jgi:2-polyprenyl-3-methyl-5-hydroxy-6-metoxy-1,4-benzoquinol methylase